MKNNIFINKLDNYVKVLVVTRDINRYIKDLINNKIYINSINYISYNKIEIIIKYKDYLKLKDRRSITKLKIIKRYGKIKLKEILNNNYILIISIIISMIVIIYLSNIIFSIDIIYSNKELCNYIEKELSKYDIKKYSYRKNYNELEIIKKKILDNNKDKLEWIEIERQGTKYIIKLEERKINKTNISNYYQHIVMNKSGIVTYISASKGEKVKNINTFIPKDSIVISGALTKPDGKVIYTEAKGRVYATVWYTIDISYPFYYKEELLTGSSRYIYYIKLLDKNYGLYNRHKYKSIKRSSKILFKNNYIPLQLVKEKQYEVKIINDIYTKEEVIDRAINLSKNKLLSTNKKIKSIDEVNILSITNNNSNLKLKLFFSVTEDVGIPYKITINE